MHLNCGTRPGRSWLGSSQENINTKKIQIQIQIKKKVKIEIEIQVQIPHNKDTNLNCEQGVEGAGQAVAKKM